MKSHSLILVLCFAMFACASPQEEKEASSETTSKAPVPKLVSTKSVDLPAATPTLLPAPVVRTEMDGNVFLTNDPGISTSLDYIRSQNQWRLVSIGTLMGAGLGIAIYTATLLRLKRLSSVARTNEGKFSAKRAGLTGLAGAACGLTVSAIAAYSTPEPRLIVIPSNHSFISNEKR